MREVRVPLLAAGIAVLLLAPGLAVASAAGQQGASATPYLTPAAASTQPTATYDLTFTLPTAGKSGCMVCHGDPNLVRIQAGQTESMWVDAALVDSSAHASVQCTGCHLDFAYSVPHAGAGNDAWRDTAKAACKNCHQEAFDAFSRGAHSAAPTPSTATTVQVVANAAPGTASTDRKPLCGDCHGSHDIQMLKDNPAGQEALHARGKQVCGDCHEDYWNNYNDPYHGAAYRRGAKDAPACWDCHGPHAIINSSDRRSPVHEGNRVDTCSACHLNEPNEQYVSYSTMVHGREDVVAANPIAAFWKQALETVRAWFD